MTVSNPRGQQRARYVDDSGASWERRVNAAYVAMPERGWEPLEPLQRPPLPRGWLPRKVIGVDASGRNQEAVVATTAAPLWTGEVSTFLVEASDASFVSCTVVRRLSERKR